MLRKKSIASNWIGHMTCMYYGLKDKIYLKSKIYKNEWFLEFIKSYEILIVLIEGVKWCEKC